LENEIKIAKEINKDINMNFGLENCAKICFTKGRDQRETYIGTHLRWTRKNWIREKCLSIKGQKSHDIKHKNEKEKVKKEYLRRSWLRRLATGLSLWRPGFDPGSVNVGFVVDKVAVGQAPLPPPQVLWFSPVNFIPPVLHYKKNRKKKIIFITGLHKKPHDCGASVASAAGPFK
jgi:hypothetical protein